jgi:UDP-GlcNAc:undecaprenyl-phosphate/decaprenyl-phosphate GlcNAc-1-phosphate transferase
VTAAFAGAAACLLTSLLIVPLIRLALRWDLIDRPEGRKTHRYPTPYVGGVAITLGTAVPASVAAGLADPRITAILLAACSTAVLGLIDDMAPVRTRIRLGVEATAALGVVLTGVQITVTGSWWIDAALTLVWIVVLTNSFNLLDNMDAALGSVAAVSAAFLAAAAVLAGEPGAALLLTALAFAAVGFLAHNWPPAKIFMGDSGSLFIGFTLAATAALVAGGRGFLLGATGALLATFVAAVDTAVVVVSRWRAGRALLAGGNDHLSHRLRRLGLSVPHTALALAGVAALAGTLGLAMTLGWISPLPLAVLAVGAGAAAAALAQKVHVYPQPRGDVPHRVWERRR